MFIHEFLSLSTDKNYDDVKVITTGLNMEEDVL